MAKCDDPGAILPFIVCHRFAHDDNYNAQLRTYRNETAQCIKDIISHCNFNVRLFYTLRIEEVKTYDAVRSNEERASEWLSNKDIFGPRLGSVAEWLLTNSAIFRMSPWTEYVDLCVRRDIESLKTCLLETTTRCKQTFLGLHRPKLRELYAPTGEWRTFPMVFPGNTITSCRSLCWSASRRERRMTRRHKKFG